jgi:hypothetical protein
MKASRLALVVISSMVLAAAQEQSLLESVKADHDAVLDTNPGSAFWSGTRPTYAEVDANGRRMPEYLTEIRSRWTKDNLYFLFICPYKNLSLKPAPDTARETYELWKWNVAEVFIGSDFHDIKRHKEFEVSPQNEWVDLDINLSAPRHEDGWLWNSFEHSARIDRSAHIWCAAMRIPLAALGTPAPAQGTAFRVNLFRNRRPTGRRKGNHLASVHEQYVSRTGAVWSAQTRHPLIQDTTRSSLRTFHHRLAPGRGLVPVTQNSRAIGKRRYSPDCWPWAVHPSHVGAPASS